MRGHRAVLRRRLLRAVLAVVGTGALAACGLLSGGSGSATPDDEPGPAVKTAERTPHRPGAAPGTPAPASTDPAAPGPTPDPTAPGPRPTAPRTVPPPTATAAPPAPASAPPPAPSEPPAELPVAWEGVDVEALPVTSKVVALTFDGGASDAGLASILGTLGDDVPATFFVTGDFARTYPAAVRSIAAAGFTVGNHSDHHDHYPQLRDAAIVQDLAAAESAITALTGRAARPLFRFPYGDRTAADIAVVNDAGYVPFRWTVDSLGWQGTSGGMAVAAVRSRVLAAARPGAIVLMHVGAHPVDGSTLDADALPAVVEGLRAAGYGFVGLRDVLP